MRAVIFKTQNGVFKFDQKEVKEIIRCNRSKYDLDQVANLQDLISTECNETIVIPEEPVYFDSIALDLIRTGTGSVFCKSCNKRYSVKQLKSIKVGGGAKPFSLGRKRKKESKSYSKRGANHHQCVVAKDTRALRSYPNFDDNLENFLNRRIKNAKININNFYSMCGCNFGNFSY